MNYRLLLMFLTLIGLSDASYLTYEHYYGGIPPCTTGIFSDCGKVLKSEYATMFGVPLAVYGSIYYLSLFGLLLLTHLPNKKNVILYSLIFLFSAGGLFFSLYLVYLQGMVIGAWCQYCLLSAATSIAIFIFSRVLLFDKYKKYLYFMLYVLYSRFIKPILFCIDPEIVHEHALYMAKMMGKMPGLYSLLSLFFGHTHGILTQKIRGIEFKSPIGLAAGYDYYASCTQILPALGFGFETVGTITHMPCEGNKKPRLGRLPKSKSLLVNKGFRNPGAGEIIKKMERQSFHFPVGVSIGVTNDESITTTSEAIEDIVQSFIQFEKSQVEHAYYELNISCPNLAVSVSFYEPQTLEKLLSKIEILKVAKPVFVKMPIDKTDEEFVALLKTIKKYSFITGVIIGNLQKDRKDPAFDVGEIKSVGKGNFSGRPTFLRSNQLVSLTYKHFKKRFIIIGCGGVFSAKDAYEKILRGATLVQLITGMIFEGPQLIAQINNELEDLLEKNRYAHISEAVGQLNK